MFCGVGSRRVYGQGCLIACGCGMSARVDNIFGVQLSNSSLSSKESQSELSRLRFGSRAMLLPKFLEDEI